MEQRIVNDFICMTCIFLYFLAIHQFFNKNSLGTKYRDLVQCHKECKKSDRLSLNCSLDLYALTVLHSQFKVTLVNMRSIGY